MLPNQIVGIAVPPYLAQCANHRHVLVDHAVDTGHVQTVHVQWSFDGSAPDAFVRHIVVFPFYCMTCCHLFGLRRVIHAPCNAIVQATNSEMSMSDPVLFQPNAPLLPIGLVVAFATAVANWG